MKTKACLRAQMRLRVRAMSAGYVRAAGARLQSAMIGLPEWHAARCVCLYLAMPGEAPTARLLEDCRQAGKRVFVPAWRTGRRGYGLARLEPDDALQAGKMSVLEPVCPRWVRRGRAGLVVVPGAAFDARGGRLGRGGGHYDRLLAGPVLRAAFKVGLAWDFQVVGRVPMQAHDVRLDAVVTEKAVYRKKTKRIPVRRDGRSG